MKRKSFAAALAGVIAIAVVVAGVALEWWSRMWQALQPGGRLDPALC